jgi:single-strand DNA-binding protein
MKSIVISGNIGKNAETRTTQSGDTVTSFNVAVEDRQGKEKSTMWFSCSIWGKRGESLCQYLTKGGKVSVSGDLSTRENEGKTYLQIRADQITLLGGGQDRGDDRGYQAPPKDAPMSQGSAMDDEIPFAPQVL